MRKNGKSAAGTQRWKCTDCSLTATAPRPDLVQAATFTAFQASAQTSQNRCHLTVHQSHPAVWEEVQAEIARRKHPSVRTDHPFAARIRCAQCGGWYGRKTWHSTRKYARHIWRCNNKYEGNKTGCTTPHIYEAQIEEAFVAALAEQLQQLPVADDLLATVDATLDTKTLRVELGALDEQAEGLVARMNTLVTQGAHAAIDPDRYDADYANLERKYQKADAKRFKTAEAIKPTKSATTYKPSRHWPTHRERGTPSSQKPR